MPGDPLSEEDESAVQLMVGRIVGKSKTEFHQKRKVIQWNTMETAK